MLRWLKLWNDIGYYMYMIFGQWIMAGVFSSVRVSYKIGGEIEVRGVGIWKIPHRFRILKKINIFNVRDEKNYIRIAGLIYYFVCPIPCTLLFIPYAILLINGIKFHETLLNIVLLINKISYIVFMTITIIQIIIEVVQYIKRHRRKKRYRW